MKQKEVTDEVVNILTEDPGRWQVKVGNPPELRKELQKVVVEAEEKAGVPDTKVYRIIVRALGVVAVFALLGAIGLAAVAKTIPESVVALGSAAIGALAGTLVTPKQQ